MMQKAAGNFTADVLVCTHTHNTKRQHNTHNTTITTISLIHNTTIIMLFAAVVEYISRKNKS